MSKDDRPRRPDRFAVLRFLLHVDDYPTEEQAWRSLSEMEVFERVGLVDRATGIIRCRRDYLEMVTEKLERSGTALPGLWRAGSIGSYLKMTPPKA